MRILGIDPGLRTLGWGIIESTGSRLSHVANGLCKSDGDDLGERLLSLHNQIVEVIAEAHPDSTTDDERWECVDIKAVKPVKTPVTLAQIKEEAALSEMALIRNSRLSVQPVTAEEWRVVCSLAGIDAG